MCVWRPVPPLYADCSANPLPPPWPGCQVPPGLRRKSLGWEGGVPSPRPPYARLPANSPCNWPMRPLPPFNSYEMNAHVPGYRWGVSAILCVHPPSCKQAGNTANSHQRTMAGEGEGGGTRDPPPPTPGRPPTTPGLPIGHWSPAVPSSATNDPKHPPVAPPPGLASQSPVRMPLPVPPWHFSAPLDLRLSASAFQ